MVMVVNIFGVIMVGMGVFYFLKPEIMKKYIEFWMEGKNFYLAGALCILISILFLLAASKCRLPGVVAAVGILSFIKGAVFFILGPEKLKSRMDWWTGRPKKIIRLFGVLAVAIGALLIYSAG